MTAKPLYHELPVSWTADDLEVSATLARPVGEGPFPAVIFVAGSGPTDRNWNTPLIPGTNGAGALLARALAEQGLITLRYDKLASGAHAAENVKRLVGKISMQSHIAELAGGVKLLAGRADVNPAKIFALTNSEGCVHALNYQVQAEQLADPPAFAGLVLTSAYARATGEIAHKQIAAQLAAVPGGDGMLAAYDASMAQFTAGQPVTISETLPEGLRGLILGITQPINQPFARELWLYNPAAKLAEVTVPVLIVLGKKDIQVDWQTEGPIFAAIAKDHPNIAIRYFENASHVLKFEPKPREQLTPTDAMVSYSADEVQLDPDPLESITAWLKNQG